ncbi:expressed unknown protein [Seminavis robusta]|uniref:Amino acid transporter transmembrane domain-containing protein n=1 Tax=Seminavis robusta TaxID=568900 RepID=A0A9N8DYX2_9STRA|nr:expressed unknown protein [Seminavis robusta]CAB9510986.1 expressed unknown protein [Seminavis robusta]|eukprot:Sro462_g147960.1 n/a (579) ;mRNA; f:29717-31759
MPRSSGYTPATTGTSDDCPATDDTFADEPISRDSSVMTSVRDRMLARHDSLFSVTSNYEDPSANDLNIWQGATLLTADCMGTGLLALPEDIKVLGRWWGLGFLILNLPINFYAGTILSDAAAYVERTQNEENEAYEKRQLEVRQLQQIQEEEELSASSKDGLMMDSPKNNRGNRSKKYASVGQTDDDTTGDTASTSAGIVMQGSAAGEEIVDRIPASPTAAPSSKHDHAKVHHDTATYDFIGMTQAMFSSRRATRWVMFLFYCNIFLVLGDYILVMSHAVSAMVGEERLCIPQAGILASTLMYGVSQIRTMANLGRAASIISLSALFVVVGQCLWAVHTNKTDVYVEASPEDFDESPSMLRKLSAMGSIGFAVGSQKLFLNIRHELAERSKAPQTLAASLSAFGIVYVGIILLAGSDPPGFLFDAIPPGWNRQLAGFLLWLHVVVSYAINSQAICASMDRLFFSNIRTCSLNEKPRIRWMCLTGGMSVLAFVVANAVPFFKDLVALIGAMTSVPLSLLLPAVYFRRFLQVSIWIPTKETLGSYSLLVYGCVFMTFALAGAISSIEMDWSNHGGVFSCH